MSQLWSNVRSALARERSLPVIRKRGVEAPVPLTFGQQRIWFVERLLKHRPQHLVNQNLEIVGPLDIARLRSALQQVIDRHEALRTCISNRDGALCQSIDSHVEVELELIDLAGRFAAESKPELDSTIRSHMPQSMDLGRTPLWRFCLFRLSDTRFLLIGRIHQMVFDRWSRDIFTRALFDKYRSPAVLPDSDQLDTPVDYGDFALWQRACYTEHWLEKNLAEWRAYFGDAPVPTCIPGDRVPGPGNVATAGRVSRAIPIPIVRRALECCHRMGISSFAFHIAAFFFLLQKYTGQDDLMICSPVAGRQSRQTRSIIGFFSNVLVYRVALDPPVTIERAINTVVERTRGFQTFSELPFDTVATSPELRTLPIDSAMFAFHNTPARIIDTGDLTVRPYSIDRRLADQRLSFSIYRRENRWYSHVSYRTEAYSREFIEALVACYQELLGALATLPSTTSLRELSLRTGPIASQHPP